VTPTRVLRLDVRDGALDVWAEPPGSVEVQGVHAQVLEATSADGTTVRMQVLSPSASPDRPRPTVLYGYGGFGIALTPAYTASALAWVQAGGTWVVANLRGGTEEGEDWHRAGMRSHKQNVFDDFAACADALVAGGWTTPDRLGIYGGSNGGLLVGAALTQRPSAFAAVVCSAPLLDMVRYERFGLGRTWNDEYGTADDPEELGWLLSYSPYHAVREGTRTRPCCSPCSRATRGSTRCTPARRAPRCRPRRRRRRRCCCAPSATSATAPARSAAPWAVGRHPGLPRLPHRTGALILILTGTTTPTDDPSAPPIGETARRAFEISSEVAAVALRIAVVVVLAIVVRWLAHRAIRKVVSRAVATPAVPEALRARFGEPSAIAQERRRQRTETVGSVLRSVATILVFAVAFATVLSELGVDLGPAIAGAGIVGVALGFGAQNLVRDYLNGIFMILEDQYGVGDAIDVGEASGIVESVGLRTTRLRNVDGTVWHVRNGEIVRVGNMSQGWSRALLDVSVAYGTDVDHAQEVIKRTADEVAAGEEVGRFVLDEPELWGVEGLGVDGIDIRLVVKTAPLEQWKVAASCVAASRRPSRPRASRSRSRSGRCGSAARPTPRRSR
jgi:small-conductance mechanosensitive channel